MNLQEGAFVQDVTCQPDPLFPQKGSNLRFAARLFVHIVLYLSITSAMAVTQSATPPFSLTINSAISTVQVGATIWISVTLQNTSDHDISVYRENAADQGGFVYNPDVKDDKGGLAPETKVGRRIQGHDTAEERDREPYITISSGGDQMLSAGKKIVDRINLTNLYTLDQPGKYSVRLRRWDAVTNDYVLSNNITITVNPR